MLFHSYLFIFVFLPVTIGLFCLLQKFGNARLMTGWLLLVSLVFYGWWNPVYIALIGFSVVANFMTGRIIQSRYDRGKPVRAFLIGGIILNLAILAWFKYANFFADIAAIELPHIILPLAISFFTFQHIAFLSDVAKGHIRDSNFADYCLFITFFPQLIAGPIVRYHEIMPQFADKSVFGVNAKNLAVGMTFFAIGLFKKLVIADQIALLSDPVFDMADQGGTVYLTEAWLAALAYSMHIYFDFSAYSDMALGLAFIFGIQLPINFFSPYKAANIIDFWRRWHITLSRFLRDYIYIPLGGNRHGKTRRYLNVSATMILGGLWHGAGWNFLIWGGLHAVFLAVNIAWQNLCRQRGIAPFAGLCGHIISVTMTFMVVTIAWVFFRAETLDGALSMFKAMMGVNGVSLPRQTPELLQNIVQSTGMTFYNIGALPAVNQSLTNALLIIVPVFIIAFFAPNTVQFMSDTLRPQVIRHYRQLNRHQKIRLLWRDNMVYAIFTAALAAVAVMFIARSTPFLYFQF